MQSAQMLTQKMRHFLRQLLFLLHKAHSRAGLVSQ